MTEPSYKDTVRALLWVLYDNLPLIAVLLTVGILFLLSGALVSLATLVLP